MTSAERAYEIMSTAPQCFNWYLGWSLILAAFVSGAFIGLFFHQDEFLGGYACFRRRLIRLGHIALAALGVINVLFGMSPWPAGADWHAEAASLCFALGGISMPLVCFLTGWRRAFRHLFFVPVAALVLAVVLMLQGGPP